ncbi:hypothetical protein NIES4074_61470 (plasmid) [Cylindrospermum sp. NIES-4074]|nr:hypothetical protein NIES4074_61470 [Cylindrospermum sp. NIES-4074]
MSKLFLTLTGTNAISHAPVYVEILDTDLETVAELAILINDKQKIQLELGKYLIKINLPSGKVIKKVLILENESSEAALPLMSSTNQQLEWHEFIGNTYNWNTQQEISQIPSIWQRLWSYDKKNWKVERWPNKWKLPQNKIAISFSLELPPNQLQLLQIGGAEIPWRFIALPPESNCEVLVSSSVNKPDFNDINVAVTSNNREAETLLSYLISGNIRAAKVVGDSFVEKLLFEKSFNALGVTIGGYFLLKLGDDERLAKWINKFVNLIQWLPDISIIHSWFLLREDDVPRVKLARSCLLEATKQGIPVYTEGMRLLFDGLLLFNQDALARGEQDVEIEQALELIRNYASAADWSKPLTTFYGAAPESPSFAITGIPGNDTIELVWLTPRTDNKWYREQEIFSQTIESRNLSGAVLSNTNLINLPKALPTRKIREVPNRLYTRGALTDKLPLHLLPKALTASRNFQDVSNHADAIIVLT